MTKAARLKIGDAGIREAQKWRGVESGRRRTGPGVSWRYRGPEIFLHGKGVGGTDPATGVHILARCAGLAEFALHGDGVGAGRTRPRWHSRRRRAPGR